MKIPFLILVFILGSTPAISAQNQVEKNIEMYTATWDNIINKRQIDQINNQNFDENVVMLTSPENIVGIADFKAYYQNFLTGFSDITFDIIDVFGQGNKIVKHWRFNGKHTGDFFGIPPTGNLVDVEGVTLVKMKNGRIAQEQDFMDNMAFMQQLGLVSDPGNMEVIANLYKSFQAGDIPGVLQRMDPDIVWNEAEGNKYAAGNPYIGPDAVLNGVFARIGAEHEYFKLEDVQLHEMHNNQVLATLRYDGKWKDGEKYNVQAAHLWTLNNGKITGFQQYVDTKTIAETNTKK
ncbi:hypothetical protein C7S20_08910 [Christiangramia fulva]|uniref:SnoaL-like domain-containing protein n=1 Tax=Christiangramia fulva TaxID=2126553 RepID=A0A2R3Z548_9FLAO|nr:ester cyclase [Christiangramia fulva]AVR45379.1 hypothetical protein C7S20_08910 [Christiangramia fulva]